MAIRSDAACASAAATTTAMSAASFNVPSGLADDDPVLRRGEVEALRGKGRIALEGVAYGGAALFGRGRLRAEEAAEVFGPLRLVEDEASRQCDLPAAGDGHALRPSEGMIGDHLARGQDADEEEVAG